MKPTGQDNSKQRDNETLVEAIKRYEVEKAKREPLLANQGRQEHEPIQDHRKPERP